MSKHKSQPITLAIPQGMHRLDLDTTRFIQGGKRREGSIFGRVIIGLGGAMIMPGGWIIAFF